MGWGCHTSMVIGLLHIQEVLHSGVTVILTHLLSVAALMATYLVMALTGFAYFSCDANTHLAAVL